LALARHVRRRRHAIKMRSRRHRNHGGHRA
jgi:hypothetical protein